MTDEAYRNDLYFNHDPEDLHEEAEIGDTILLLKQRLDAARSDFDLMIQTFRHGHVSGTTKGLPMDTCAQCKLDLRHPVHFRA